VNAAEADPVRVSPLRRLLRVASVGALLLFIALLAYGLTTTAPDNGIDQKLAENQSAAAPSFSLELLERGVLPPRLQRTIAPSFSDGKLSLRELRGTPVVLNFWATWCPPCREEAPRLRSGWDRWGARGVLFLGLDIQDIRSDARDFLHSFRITYPTIRDPGKGVANRYGATGLPETYFISRRGRVVAHVIGVVSTRQLASGIDAAIAGRPEGAHEGGARRPAR
jgi:cytochrome c biogenesis protein CcmG/thiol:disulfide interchange protein DsbE